jgi:hypothetical protein
MVQLQVIVALTAAVVLLPGATSAAPARPAVWFAPLPPLPTSELRPFVGSPGFMRLFTKKAAWPNAARRVSVFKLYGEWVAHAASTTQLRQAVRDLKRRKIAIAVEAGPLDAPADCGQGVEGFAGTQEGLTIARNIKDAGGTLRYVAFDEPFFYAALYSGPNACGWDTRRVAQAIAAYVRAIRTVFPKASFGDTEPLTTGAHLQRYEEWIDAYRAVTGESLSFLHLDVWYTLPRWPQLLRELEDFARSRGVPFGVIYNGDGQDAADGTWLVKAQERFQLYETEGGRPDHAVFQSWVDKPDRVLPEKQRTFTNLILRYTRPRARLELERSGTDVSGRLVAARPVARAPIRFTAERTYEGSAYSDRDTVATASATTGPDGRFRATLTAPPEAAIVARYAGSAGRWPAYAVSGGGAGLRNVARGRPVSASAAQPTEAAANAVDGDATTRWGAGQFAPQWLEVDLGEPVAIAAIRLGVDQFPDGDTVHAVLGRAPGGSFGELHVFSGRTATGDVLQFVPPSPWEGIRYLRVETRASPSWVAWQEVEVFTAG